MPLPRALARLNRRITNPITRRVAGRLPGFAIVVHHGRVSGRTYRTPVNAFRQPAGYVIALTYGPHAQWLQNVLAGGGCVLEVGGRQLAMTNPRLLRDPTRHLAPPPVRLILHLLGVDWFLTLDLTT